MYVLIYSCSGFVFLKKERLFIHVLKGSSTLKQNVGYFKVS